MSAVGVAVIAVAFVAICVAALFADRLLDATAGGSYVLVQRAWRRRGHRLFWMVLLAAVILAAVLTIVGILANDW